MLDTVKTNMGEMPLEDYLDIVARQYGFEDYKKISVSLESENLSVHEYEVIRSHIDVAIRCAICELNEERRGF